MNFLYERYAVDSRCLWKIHARILQLSFVFVFIGVVGFQSFCWTMEINFYWFPATLALPLPLFPNLKWKIDFVCLNIIPNSWKYWDILFTSAVFFVYPLNGRRNYSACSIGFLSFADVWVSIRRSYNFWTNTCSRWWYTADAFMGSILVSCTILSRFSKSFVAFRSCPSPFSVSFPYMQSVGCTKLSHWLYNIIYTKATCFFPHFSIHLARYRIQLLFAILQIVFLFPPCFFLLLCSGCWLFRYVYNNLGK